jgi:hypothetical protein
VNEHQSESRGENGALDLSGRKTEGLENTTN